jgi:hypothetical protein
MLLLSYGTDAGGGVILFESGTAYYGDKAATATANTIWSNIREEITTVLYCSYSIKKNSKNTNLRKKLWEEILVKMVSKLYTFKKVFWF